MYIDVLTDFKGVWSEVAIRIRVAFVFITLANNISLGSCLTCFVDSRNHFFHSLSGISLDVIYVILTYTELTRLVVLAPVHLAVLEDFSLRISNWEARTLFSDLLQHL